ncbi:MAG: hypothetical protein AAF958_13195 [Planctomycetota bacterium]
MQWSLDGGGRWMIRDIIRTRKIQTILEIGVFLGGSVETWLESSRRCTVLAVDTWPECNQPGQWDPSSFVEENSDNIALARQMRRESGFYNTFLANLWPHRERVIPIRRSSPEVLYEMAEMGLHPDLIYLDSDKVGTELEICHELFPGAIMSGDDWEFDPGAGYPIRAPVHRFCEKHALNVYVENASWVIAKSPLTFSYRYRLAKRRFYKQRRKLKAQAILAWDRLARRDAA